MNQTRITALAALALLFSAATLHAQTGCTDSPENPTAILGIVGAGAWLLASSRRRIGSLARRALRQRRSKA
jgi:XrtJ-associated TM-motif-TM protein